MSEKEMASSQRKGRFWDGYRAGWASRGGADLAAIGKTKTFWPKGEACSELSVNCSLVIKAIHEAKEC